MFKFLLLGFIFSFNLYSSANFPSDTSRSTQPLVEVLERPTEWQLRAGQGVVSAENIVSMDDYFFSEQERRSCCKVSSCKKESCGAFPVRFCCLVTLPFTAVTAAAMTAFWYVIQQSNKND